MDRLPSKLWLASARLFKSGRRNHSGIGARHAAGAALTFIPPLVWAFRSRCCLRQTLKDRARVHLHAYTFETIATVMSWPETSSTGRSCAAQLRLADPTLLLPGAPIHMRQFSPVVTVGGGVVLDASPIPRGMIRF